QRPASDTAAGDSRESPPGPPRAGRAEGCGRPPPSATATASRRPRWRTGRTVLDRRFVGQQGNDELDVGRQGNGDPGEGPAVVARGNLVDAVHHHEQG